MTTKILLTVPEIAEATSYDPSTVRRWIASGRLRAYKAHAGGTWRVRTADLERFIENELIAGPAAALEDLAGDLTELRGTG